MYDEKIYVIRLRKTEGKKIYLDPIDLEGCYLYDSEIKKLNIIDGIELSEEKLKAIRETIALPRAKKRVLGLLAKRDQTEQQIRDKLLASYNDHESVEAAISFAKQLGYIDDYRYVEDYIYSRRHKKSFPLMRMELGRKGIAEAVIEEVFEAHQPEKEDIREAVRKYAAKYMAKSQNPYTEYDYMARQKTVAHFVRKGYQADLVKAVLEELREEE